MSAAAVFSNLGYAAGRVLFQRFTWASVEQELRNLSMDWLLDTRTTAIGKPENVNGGVNDTYSSAPCAANAIIIVSDVLQCLSCNEVLDDTEGKGLQKFGMSQSVVAKLAYDLHVKCLMHLQTCPYPHLCLEHCRRVM